jgi:hypothetical protein
MASWLLGVTGEWEEYEASFYKKMRQALGNAPAEAVMYGLPQILGVSLTNRVGLDSLLMFGGPKKADAASTAEWLLPMIAGPSASLLWNMGKGARSALGKAEEGDTGGGVNKLIQTGPFPKFMKDMAKAYESYSTGKKSDAGKPLALPGSQQEGGLRDAIIKGAGFQPATEARVFQGGGAGYENKAERGRKEDASRLKDRWQKAAPGEARNKVWQEIRRHNQDNPDDDPITQSDLRKFEKRRKKTNKEAEQELRRAS